MTYIYYYKHIWDSTDGLIKENYHEIVFALKLLALALQSVIFDECSVLHTVI